jgi:hypothetical protein
MDWISVANELTPYLRQGHLGPCISRVSTILAGLPHSPYHLVLDLAFTNDMVEIATSFDQFFMTSAKTQGVAALYAKTNGFFINPAQWYFEIYSYSHYGGHTNYDWLSHWQGSPSEEITLTGLEALQAVYQHHQETQYFRILSEGGSRSSASTSGKRLLRFASGTAFSELNTP